jgi:hypothetical protein
MLPQALGWLGSLIEILAERAQSEWVARDFLCTHWPAAASRDALTKSASLSWLPTLARECRVAKSPQRYKLS